MPLDIRPENEMPPREKDNQTLIDTLSNLDTGGIISISAEKKDLPRIRQILVRLKGDRKQFKSIYSDGRLYIKRTK